MLDRNYELKCFVDIEIELLKIFSCKGEGICDCNLDFNCHAAGKHPTEKGALENAKPYKDLSYFNGYNIGVKCGKKVVVIDVDRKNNGHISLAKIEEEHGVLPKTWVCETPGGWHYYYDVSFLDDGIKSKSFGGIDIQGLGRYVVAPTSLHKTGKYYEWADYGHPDDVELAKCPNWVIDICKQQKPEELEEPQEKLTEYEFRQVVQALNMINPDIHHNLWVDTGMAMHDSGWGREAFREWDDWSKKGTKYKDGVTQRKWQSFSYRSNNKKTIRTIFDYSKKYSLGQEYAEDVHLSIYENLPEEEDSKKFIIELPNGFSSRLASEILENCYIKKRSFAIEAAFMIGACIMQRRYKSGRITPNLYSILYSFPNDGKNDYLEIVKKVILNIDKTLLCPSLGSDRGLREAFVTNKSKILIEDEYIEALIEAHKPNSIYGLLVKDYKSLWGHCSELQEIQVKKTKENTPSVSYPKFSIFGAGTFQQFVKLLEQPLFNGGGLLSRFNLIYSDEPVFGNRNRDLSNYYTPNSDIIAGLIDIYNQSNYDNLTFISDDYQVVDIPKSKEVDQFLLNLEEETDLKVSKMSFNERLSQQNIDSLNGRLLEKMQRYALILTIFDRRKKIELDYIKWAYEYCLAQTNKMAELVKQYGLSKNENMQEQILATILAYENEHKMPCTKTHIYTQNRRLGNTVINDTLAFLIAQEKILHLEKKSDKNNKSMVHYYQVVRD